MEQTILIRLNDPPAATAANKPVEMLVIPDGYVKSLNRHYLMDAEAATSVITKFVNHGVDLPVDYDHGSVAPDGQPRPASGWISKLRYAKGEGLYATVSWTERALSLIRASEYRYLSPAFSINQTIDKRVNRLHSVALTNTPATPGGLPVKIAASTTFKLMEESNMPDEPMKEQGGAAAVIAEIKAALGISGSGTLEEVLAMIRDAIAAKLGGKKEDEQVAASVRTRLGLKADADKSEVVLALSALQRGATDGNELASMREKEADRTAQSHVDRLVSMHKINARDTEAMSAALHLAKTDPARLDALMSNVAPYCPTGKTAPPTNRQSIIIAASREFQTDQALQRTTSARAFASLKLRDAGMEALSEDEARTMVA